jgi:MraZ protein
VTRGLERCLFVFTPREWNNIILKLKQQPMLRGKAREFMRLFFSGSCRADCDRQGRIGIPRNLIEWAGIEKDVVAVGVLNRVEIWDERRWEDYSAEREKEYEAIAESLIDGV